MDRVFLIERLTSVKGLATASMTRKVQPDSMQAANRSFQEALRAALNTPLRTNVAARVPLKVGKRSLERTKGAVRSRLLVLCD
jgi:hypothetical protein